MHGAAAVPLGLAQGRVCPRVQRERHRGELRCHLGLHLVQRRLRLELPLGPPILSFLNLNVALLAFEIFVNVQVLAFVVAEEFAVIKEEADLFGAAFS